MERIETVMEDANFIAQDADGNTHFFKNRPYRDYYRTEWKPMFVSGEEIFDGPVGRVNTCWDKSLIDLSESNAFFDRGILVGVLKDSKIEPTSVFDDGVVMEEGRKFDDEKSRMDLCDPKFFLGIGEILNFGAKKYEENNWQKIEKKRYIAACYRHLIAYHGGERDDPESGKHHLLHAACCLMFLFWKDNND